MSLLRIVCRRKGTPLKFAAQVTNIGTFNPVTYSAPFGRGLKSIFKITAFVPTIDFH